MKRIFLTGYMGSGKTTLGSCLMELTGLSFIDLDMFIEKRFHKTIRQLFDERGEDGFREVEKRMLHEVAEFEDVIISTGGGTPCFFDNMAFMKSCGTTVYLRVSVAELTARLEVSKHTRPVLKNRSGEELKEFISNNLATRLPYYEQADIIFDADTMNTREEVRQLSQRLCEIISLDS